jgi:D-alanyl-D-alanine dipeptidase
MRELARLSASGFVASLLCCVFATCFAGAAENAAASGKLPGGYVYLREIEPTIIQDMRYATAANFTQAPVPGYKAGECIVLREAAEGLKLIQADLRMRGLSLKVYDCYRPVRAVKSFMRWVGEPEAAGSERQRPRTERSDLVKLGYISASSIHSKGAAIDLTLVALPAAAIPPFDPKGTYGPCNGIKAEREPDNGLDMGTSFDCFDPMSATASAEIAPEQAGNRKMLVDAMTARGFKNYAREWWHFTYVMLPGLPKAEDFIIMSRTPATGLPRRQSPPIVDQAKKGMPR